MNCVRLSGVVYSDVIICRSCLKPTFSNFPLEVMPITSHIRHSRAHRTNAHIFACLNGTRMTAATLSTFSHGLLHYKRLSGVDLAYGIVVVLSNAWPVQPYACLHGMADG